MKYQLQVYTPDWKGLWDDAIEQVRQSSFLFKRDFMDYHSDRFQDISVLFLNTEGRVVACFPANVSRSEAHTVESHGGLTYGGLLTLPEVTAEVTCEMMETLWLYYQGLGYKQLRYKSVPHIYRRYPAEEDLYALYRLGARLVARSISSVIDLRQPYTLSKLRKRKVKKAQKYGLTRTGNLVYLSDFWQMLAEVLQQRHGTLPVHSLEELQLLCERFPERIRLCTVHADTTLLPATEVQTTETLCAPSKTMVAGCLLFLTDKVVHVQYIAANDLGCEIGALDWLFDQLIQDAQASAEHVPFFDFGISTEAGGQVLNGGLIFQKEGFGARAICYDTYAIQS